MNQSYDSILTELEDLVLSSTRVLFSNNRLVNEDEFLRVFDDLRASLPQEIAEAKKLISDKQRLKEEAEKEAKAIIEQAKKHVETLLDENNISKLAEEQAKEWIQKARQEQREIEKSANDYASSIFEYTENQIEKLLLTVKNSYETFKERQGINKGDN